MNGRCVRSIDYSSLYLTEMTTLGNRSHTEHHTEIQLEIQLEIYPCIHHTYTSIHSYAHLFIPYTIVRSSPSLRFPHTKHVMRSSQNGTSHSSNQPRLDLVSPFHLGRIRRNIDRAVHCVSGFTDRNAHSEAYAEPCLDFSEDVRSHTPAHVLLQLHIYYAVSSQKPRQNLEDVSIQRD